ncbi:MAG: hypothetical protein ACK56F_09110, partial [bacterium]
VALGPAVVVEAVDGRHEVEHGRLREPLAEAVLQRVVLAQRLEHSVGRLIGVRDGLPDERLDGLRLEEVLRVEALEPAEELRLVGDRHRGHRVLGAERCDLRALELEAVDREDLGRRLRLGLHETEGGVHLVEQVLHQLVVLGDDLALHVDDGLGHLDGLVLDGDLDALVRLLELGSLGAALGRAVELKVRLHVLDIGALEAEGLRERGGGRLRVAGDAALRVDELRDHLAADLALAVRAGDRDGVGRRIELEEPEEARGAGRNRRDRLRAAVDLTDV